MAKDISSTTSIPCGLCGENAMKVMYLVIFTDDKGLTQMHMTKQSSPSQAVDDALTIFEVVDTPKVFTIQPVDF